MPVRRCRGHRPASTTTRRERARGLTASAHAARIAVVLCAVCAACALWAAPAEAKKKRKPKVTPLAVVVLPFVGKGSGGVDTKDALELELELVDTVAIKDSEAVEGALKRAGRQGYEPGQLSAILADKRIDVLIRGERGAGVERDDALLVTAYGRDGRPRKKLELALNAGADGTAAEIVDALRPSFRNWRTLKPLDAKPAAAAGGDDDDLLTGDDSAPARRPIGGGADDDATAGDDDGGDAAKKNKNKGGGGGGVEPLGFNDDDDLRAEAPKKKREADDEAPKKKRRARARIDDDAPADPDDEPARLDDDGRRLPGGGDVADRVDKPLLERVDHLLALSAGFDGATWSYGFDAAAGGGPGDSNVAASFFPGGSMHADVWFLDFAGFDVDGGLSAIPFTISPPTGFGISPSDFVSLQWDGGAALRARFPLTVGALTFGLGGRAGYRGWGAVVPTQTLQPGGTPLTVVPGFLFHGAAIGPELSASTKIAGNRFEAVLGGDVLPLTFYKETPDNPGSTTLAFGWDASLRVRYEVWSGIFGEVRLRTNGAKVRYEGEGRRVTFVGTELVPLTGGDVLNFRAGFTVGLGYLF